LDLNIHFINAFTDVIFKGNSAAVVITDTWLTDGLMQSIATENNLSETAFIVRNENDIYDIRWFSPLTEIDFCGHATLASAFVLLNQISNVDVITFNAKAVGDVKVTREDNGYMQMDFPVRKPAGVSEIPQALIDGLSIEPLEVLLSEQAYFVIYPNEADVLAVKQNSEQLKKLAPYDVVVTAAGQKYDFISRYFWPANGGDEDPVTGSIHAGLAPFWADRLGKTKLSAYQASIRGGEIFCQVEGNRVFVSGQAIKYLTGSIEI